MIEDARLMTAEEALALGIPDVTRVTGEVNAGIERHHGGHGFADGSSFHLFRQNNIFFRKLLQTRGLVLSSNSPISMERPARAY
jgi:hypothetical protein